MVEQVKGIEIHRRKQGLSFRPIPATAIFLLQIPTYQVLQLTVYRWNYRIGSQAMNLNRHAVACKMIMLNALAFLACFLTEIPYNRTSLFVITGTDIQINIPTLPLLRITVAQSHSLSFQQNWMNIRLTQSFKVAFSKR